jgi:hypothetical protein
VRSSIEQKKTTTVKANRNRFQPRGVKQQSAPGDDLSVFFRRVHTHLFFIPAAPFELDFSVSYSEQGIVSAPTLTAK